MGVKRTSRLLRLVVTIQSECQNNIGDLVETLNVSRRTLYRDLRTLQEAGIPCYFDRCRQSYRVDDGFHMPPANLTPKEAFGLLLLVHKARGLLELPFSGEVLCGVLKIESNLPLKVREYCRRRLKDVSVHGARSKPEGSMDERFEFLQQAIGQKQILEVTYNSKSDPPVITCRFSPFHLVYTNSWYVMGKVDPSGQIQSIKLSDIQRMEPTRKCFITEGRFDPADYLGRAWAATPEGRLYNVKLRFAPEVAREVTAVQWHSTQYATIEEDGSALLEFRVDGLSEISWWIVGFGDKVEVLAPQVLRQKIHEIAANMSKQSEANDRGSGSPGTTVNDVTV